jgi:hypothetical protein
MPKERLTRTLLGCGLGLLLAAPGCRTGREVPAAPPLTNPAAAGAPDGRVGFTQDSRPATGQAYGGSNMVPGQLPQPGQLGQAGFNNGQAADPGLNAAGYGQAGSPTNPPQSGSRWDAQPPVGGTPAGGAGMVGAGDPTAGNPATPTPGMPARPYETAGDTLQDSNPGLNTMPR